MYWCRSHSHCFRQPILIFTASRARNGRHTVSTDISKKAIITKGFCFTFMSMFCGSFILYMMITTVSEYAGSFGASKAVSGLVSSIFLIGELVTRLLFPKILGRLGWKKTIFFSMTAQLTACCLYFVISNIFLLILIRLVHGFCFGMAASVVSNTGIYLIPKERYGEGNGILMTSTSLSVCLGPLFGGIIYEHFGSYGCFITAIILAVLMTSGVYLARAPYPDIRPGAASERKDDLPFLDRFIEKKALAASLCIFFCGAAYSCVLSFIRLFGSETGLSDSVSFYFVVYAAVLLFSRPLVGRLQDRYGDNAVAYPCISMQIISFVLLAFIPGPVTVLIAAALLALGYGTLNSVFITIACRRASGDRIPYATMTYWIGTDLGVGLGPVWLGAVAESFGYIGMFSAAACVSAVTIPVYILFCHRSAYRGKAD